MNSVCIATYNGEKYIQAQLESIINQINPDDEIIISDDGSTDYTLKIVEKINDNRIKVIHGGFKDFKKNFINSLNHAKGDLIFLSDQDDVWLPGKYVACVELLKVNDLVITDSILVNEDLEVIEKSFFKFYNSGKGILKNSINNTYFGACMAFNRKVLENAKPFPATKEIGHDIWLGLVAEMTRKVVFLPVPYLLYRRHDKALTNLNSGLLNRSKRSLIVKLWSRVIVLYVVTQYYLKSKLCKRD